MSDCPDFPTVSPWFSLLLIFVLAACNPAAGRETAPSTPTLSPTPTSRPLIAIEQLATAAAFYFPEAQTLCVAYDGQPTAIEDGGPIFLHDASGCPLPFP